MGSDGTTANSLRVLVLDDEQVIANTLALILSRSGFEAKAVYRGEDAVEMAIELKPDILISDVVMEGMNGIEVAIRISELVPHCRIVLLSGQAATADLLRKSERDGYHFDLLLKPVHPLTIIQHLTSKRRD